MNVGSFGQMTFGYHMCILMFVMIARREQTRRMRLMKALVDLERLAERERHSQMRSGKLLSPKRPLPSTPP